MSEKEKGFYSLRGQVAIVTGGGQEIGEAIARRLHSAGARVGILDVNEANALSVAQSMNGLGVRCDVSSNADVTAAVAEVRRALGPIDIVVNNAGIAGKTAPLWELSESDLNHVYAVNLKGVFLVCRNVIEEMLSRGYGRIVNVASIAGKEGNPNASAYSASKAGVISLTKSLGKELAQTGVLVNCITPAAAKTAIFEQMTREHIAYMLSKIPMNRFVNVEEIAALAGWLASEDCSFSTGAVFDISGGRATY
jgi:3-oxoacyl-[acyl-carrier protein] reductase